ncbi:TRAP transporter small permease [Brevibacillus choshinensis]|uniref:TRAP transporter small permease n=1 Tax=Brevibacillus choshinensis TaxID=54911 RepID=UPI002E2294E6|nr:TRAP transporter small permease [Brevibacillus choshinensis]
MNALFTVVQSLTRVAKWIALATMSFMMLFITIGVIGRAFGHPVLGDLELVQTMMVVLIMFGLAYSQAEDAHISIGLLVDRFSPRIQSLLDVIGYLLTVLICFMISWVFLGLGLENLLGLVLTTDLLGIPLYPLHFIAAIGFFMWGMEALLKMVLAIIHFKKGEIRKRKEEVSH